MSTGSVSYNSADSNDYDSTFDFGVSGYYSTSIGIHQLLIDAIRAGELDTLQKILSQDDQFDVTDNDMHSALNVAAQTGSVEACRLLWAGLSSRTKTMYVNATIYEEFGYLNEAAYYGHLDVVRLFVEEFHWDINQQNYNNSTPLCYAVRHLETARFLLENGADVNQGGRDGYGPLAEAVEDNNEEAVRLLLIDYHANPNLLVNRRPYMCVMCCRNHRNADIAILNGNAEILRVLLEHGAVVGHGTDSRNYTPLTPLFDSPSTSRETKLSICHLLVEHATEDHATALLIHRSFSNSVKASRHNDGCEILLQSGINPRSRWVWDIAMQERNEAICRLLVQYGADPFSAKGDEVFDERGHVASPFQTAARLEDTSIFEYFLDLWNEQFSATVGKNGDGDYPLHVVCCDAHVSLAAIQVLVARQADILSMVDGEQGLLPFHFAANWGASLDVIFYLLQHCPDALSHVGSAEAAAAAVGPNRLSPAGETTVNALKSTGSGGDDDDVRACGPVKKKAKTVSIT